MLGEQRHKRRVPSVDSFELTEAQLRSRRGTKWNRYPAEVLPAWVADMDFAVPDAVQEAILKIVEPRDYGYGSGYGVRMGQDGLAAAFAERMEQTFGWRPDPDGVQPLSELIQAMFSSVLASPSRATASCSRRRSILPS
jgi:cystathionine beta-lyase